MPPRTFQRTYDVHAIVRLLVPLPVSIDWPSGVQTLTASDLTYPPYGSLALSQPGSADPGAGEPFDSAAHAIHTAMNGLRVSVPSRMHTFVQRLVREGRAEYVEGPHLDLYWLNQTGMPPAPESDARYTFQRGRTLGDKGLGAQIPPPRNPA